MLSFTTSIKRFCKLEWQAENEVITILLVNSKKGISINEFRS